MRSMPWTCAADAGSHNPKLSYLPVTKDLEEQPQVPVQIRQILIRQIPIGTRKIRLDSKQGNSRPGLPFNIFHDNRERENMGRDKGGMGYVPVQ